MKGFAVLLTILLVLALLAGVTEFPTFGSPDSPAMGTLYRHYTEEGLAETGAENLVAGIVLDYRALDTLLEAVVILTAGLIIYHLIGERR